MDGTHLHPGASRTRRAVREERGSGLAARLRPTPKHLEWAQHLRDVDHLTMVEIAAKTGIARTSLYRHFRRMDDQAAAAPPL